jgi:hypothetical protein
VSSEKQRLIGIQVATVEKASGMRNLYTVGRLAADETSIYIINATVNGWITSASSSATISYVKKMRPLPVFEVRNSFLLKLLIYPPSMKSGNGILRLSANKKPLPVSFFPDPPKFSTVWLWGDCTGGLPAAPTLL